MEAKQLLEFQQVGLDQIQAEIAETVTAFQNVEKAKDKAFDGLANDAKTAGDAVADTAGKVNSAATNLKGLEKESQTAGRGMGFFRSAMSGASDAVKGAINNISVFGVSIGDARQKLNQTRQSLTVYARANGIAGASAQAAGKSSVVGFNLARVGALALRTALGPIGLILTAVVAAFTLLAAVAKRSEPIMDAFATVTAAVSAGFDVLIDRAVKVAEAFFYFSTGQFGKAFDAAKASVSGLNDELRTEIALASQLRAELIRLERNQLLLNAQRSLTAARLKELNFIAEDTTKTTQERIAASKESLRIEEDLATRELENAKGRLANELAQLEVGEKTVTLLDRLRDGTIAYAEVRDQLGQNISNQDDVERVLGIVSEIGAKEAASLELRTTANNKLNTIQQQAEQARLKAIETRRKAEQELADFREQIEQQLTQLAIDNSEGEARIELERQVAQAQIDEAERVAREKFAAAKQAFDIEAEFAQLREAVDKDATEQALQFRRQAANQAIEAERDLQLAHTELLTASADLELNLEEFKAQERARITRESLLQQRAAAAEIFGEDSAEALAIDVQLRVAEGAAVEVVREAERRVQEEQLKAIDQRQQIRLAEIDLIQQSADEDLSIEEFKQREKTNVLIGALQERRGIILAQFGENSPEVRLLDLEIEGLQQDVDALNNINLDPLTKIKNRIQKAFNLDDETTALLAEQAKGAFNNIVAGLESIYERQLIEQDRLIEQIDSRVVGLEDALNRELELQEAGLANNADLRQRELDEELRQKERAEARRLEIEKKAARQQLILESAQQVSSLALASARLIASEASKGLIGVILAGAGIATIFSIAAKAKAQAAQFSTPPSFREGGIFEGVLSGPSHEQGGILGRYTKGGKSYVAEMEGGEAVTPVKQTRKFSGLLEAVRTDAISGMSNDAVLNMMGRNPTVGLTSRVGSVAPSQSKDVMKAAKMIVAAIQSQPQIVPEGGYAWIDPKGIRPPTKGKT